MKRIARSSRPGGDYPRPSRVTVGVPAQPTWQCPSACSLRAHSPPSGYRVLTISDSLHPGCDDYSPRASLFFIHHCNGSKPITFPRACQSLPVHSAREHWRVAISSPRGARIQTGSSRKGFRVSAVCRVAVVTEVRCSDKSLAELGRPYAWHAGSISQRKYPSNPRRWNASDSWERWEAPVVAGPVYGNGERACVIPWN